MNRLLFITIVAAVLALCAAATAAEPLVGSIRLTSVGIALSVPAVNKGAAEVYLLAFTMDGDGEAQAVDAINRGVKHAKVTGSVRKSETDGRNILRVAKIEYLAEPERKLYRVTVGLNERGHVIAKSDKLGTVVLGFDNLGDVIFVHKETVRRLKEKLPLTAEISGFVYPDDKEMFSTKLFNWVKP